MPISIDGTGSITGLSAGGLPDLSAETADIAAGAVTTAKLADAGVTAAKLSGAQSGSAPIYAARAWVNFNGTSTVSIRASGNVSSITDNGTGQYTVNFTTALSSEDYAASVTIASNSLAIGCMIQAGSSGGAATTKTTSALRVLCSSDGGTNTDANNVNVIAFV